MEHKAFKKRISPPSTGAAPRWYPNSTGRDVKVTHRLSLNAAPFDQAPSTTCHKSLYLYKFRVRTSMIKPSEPTELKTNTKPTKKKLTVTPIG